MMFCQPTGCPNRGGQSLMPNRGGRRRGVRCAGGHDLGGRGGEGLDAEGLFEQVVGEVGLRARAGPCM